MNELSRDDIRVAVAYEESRDSERRRIADAKRHRRVHLSDRVSLVFENHETVRHAVEELVRAERIRDEAAIAQEVAAFNALVPAHGDLSACLYLEISDPAEIDTVADALRGVAETVSLVIDGEPAVADVHVVDEESDLALTCYLNFHLTAPQRSRWLAGSRIALSASHPSCSVEVELTPEQREALAADLA